MSLVNDQVTALLRTLWPMLVGHLLAWLLVGTGALGLDVDPVWAQQTSGWVVSGVVYVAGRWLEGRTGDRWWSRLGRWAGAMLLGSRTQPTYQRPTE